MGGAEFEGLVRLPPRCGEDDVPRIRVVAAAVLNDLATDNVDNQASATCNATSSASGRPMRSELSWCLFLFFSCSVLQVPCSCQRFRGAGYRCPEQEYPHGPTCAALVLRVVVSQQRNASHNVCVNWMRRKTWSCSCGPRTDGQRELHSSMSLRQRDILERPILEAHGERRGWRAGRRAEQIDVASAAPAHAFEWALLQKWCATSCSVTAIGTRGTHAREHRCEHMLGCMIWQGHPCDTQCIVDEGAHHGARTGRGRRLL